MTFVEAYEKTGRIFCVTLSSTTEKAPPVLLNYLTTPHITIASAVIASAAVPGFIPPVQLQYSKCYMYNKLLIDVKRLKSKRITFVNVFELLKRIVMV
jgi:predicted acylesterase/phospholipase RssA